LRQAEHAKQLAVQVVAVGDDHDGRVLHRGSCITRAAKQVMVMLLPLPWVCHTTPPLPLRATGRAVGARRRHHLVDGRAHRVELVVAGDLLDQPPSSSNSTK
jgi:hypothetical protein